MSDETAAKTETNGEDGVKSDAKEGADAEAQGEAEAGALDDDAKAKAKGKAKGKLTLKEKLAQQGIVGQEAIKMRREARKKRQEEYKKNLEATCKYRSLHR